MKATNYRVRGFKGLMAALGGLVLLFAAAYGAAAADTGVLKKGESRLTDFVPFATSGGAVKFQGRATSGAEYYDFAAQNGGKEFYGNGRFTPATFHFTASEESFLAQPGAGYDNVVRIKLNGDFKKIKVSGQTVKSGGMFTGKFYIYLGAANYAKPLWESAGDAKFELTIDYKDGDELFLATNGGTDGTDTDYAIWKSVRFTTAQGAASDPAPIITSSYLDALGRSPTAAELTHWKGRKDWSAYNELIAFHRTFIKQDEAARKSIIVKSYQEIFWRGPDEAELKYWQARLKSTGMNYKELLTNHRDFLAINKTMREALIHNAHRVVYGRDATAAELKNLSAPFVSGKMGSYKELFEQLKGKVKASKELKTEILSNSYATALGRTIAADELKYWLNRMSTTGETFTDMLKNHREYIRTDKGGRDVMIVVSYQQTFGRAPIQQELNFWSDRLKKYGLIYEEVVLAHEEWLKYNAQAASKNTALVKALTAKGLTLDAKTGNILNAKKAVVYKNGQYFFGTVDGKGAVSVPGGGIIAAKGSTIVASGGGNVLASGGGNIVAAGGGNILASGAGNILASGGGNILASGAGNILASGGGNVIASGAGNIVSLDGSNQISALNAGGLLLLKGGAVVVNS